MDKSFYKDRRFAKAGRWQSFIPKQPITKSSVIASMNLLKITDILPIFFICFPVIIVFSFYADRY